MTVSKTASCLSSIKLLCNNFAYCLGSNGPGSQGSTTTNYNYHYLGIRRHVPHEDSTQPPAPAKPVKVLTAPSKDKDASAYAKVMQMKLSNFLLFLFKIISKHLQ
jgi:hypothetical protein